MTQQQREPGGPVPTAEPGQPRRKWRLMAIGGIAAVAIVGGGITAAASAAAPVTTTTSTVTPTTGAAAPTGTAVPNGGVAPTGTAAPNPPAPGVHKPHLDGTVTSVSGTTVLIKDRDGFTRTIVLSSKTVYADGLEAALAIGTKIHAEGTVDANGTSLDATAVGAARGPAGGAGGWPGPRGGGPGGPGGPGHRQFGNGSGTATAAPTAPTTSSAAPTTS